LRTRRFTYFGLCPRHVVLAYPPPSLGFCKWSLFVNPFLRFYIPRKFRSSLLHSDSSFFFHPLFFCGVDLLFAFFSPAFSASVPYPAQPLRPAFLGFRLFFSQSASPCTSSPSGREVRQPPIPISVMPSLVQDAGAFTGPPSFVFLSPLCFYNSADVVCPSFFLISRRHIPIGFGSPFFVLVFLMFPTPSLSGSQLRTSRRPFLPSYTPRLNSPRFTHPTSPRD